jgi:hypothetical protein
MSPAAREQHEHDLRCINSNGRQIKQQSVPAAYSARPRSRPITISRYLPEYN